jgi:hypothetical protein
MEPVTAGSLQVWRDRERLRDLVVDANDGIVAIAGDDDRLPRPRRHVHRGGRPRPATTVDITGTVRATALAAA